MKTDKLEELKKYSHAKEWKRLRKKHGLTLRQVEEKTGISNAYLSQLENGKIKKPSMDVVFKLYAVYSQYIPSEVCRCPNCKSDNVSDASVTKSNGVFGPGFSSWKLFDAMLCNNCGVYFKKVNGNGKPDVEDG